MALEAAQRQNARRILRMRLRVGDLSGVVIEALQFALETVVEGTPAEGARIDIERVTPACICSACGCEYDLLSPSDAPLEGRACARPGARGSVPLQQEESAAGIPSMLSYSYECPKCGTVNSDLFRGKEMDLVSLEVD